MDQFARDGLRTLMIATKELDWQFYKEWADKYSQALISINKEKEIAKVADEIEHSLELIGSTAIEDKL